MPTRVPTGRSDPNLNELSSVIGELRNFAAQQSVTNTHMLEELKKISERMSNFGEIGATFVEYRKTLHERFGKIGEQIVSIDNQIEHIDERVSVIEITVATWKANWKVLVTVFYVLSTATSAIVTHYGSAILHAIP